MTLVGVFLRLGDTIPDFAVYLFSGMIVVNLFSEALGNATAKATESIDADRARLNELVAEITASTPHPEQ